MSVKWLQRALWVAIGVSLIGGCLPRQGTPVFVDYAAAEVWSGKGVLVEVSKDERECRVVFRDSNLITRNQWVDCRYVHPRKR